MNQYQEENTTKQKKKPLLMQDHSLNLNFSIFHANLVSKSREMGITDAKCSGTQDHKTVHYTAGYESFRESICRY